MQFFRKSMVLALIPACAGLAQAQEGVTVYGTVDVGLAHLSSSGLKGQNVVDSGLNAPSRLGFRGSESLSDALKAVYTLEYNIAPDQNSGIGDVASKTQWTGSQSRQAFVGLQGDFGSLLLGRLQTAGFVFACSYNPVAGGAFNTTDRMKSASQLVCGNPGRADNAVGYVSPVWGGLSLALNHARITENASLQPTGSDAHASQLALSYRRDALQAGAIYARKAMQNTLADDDVRELGLGASYDFGVAKLFAMVQNQQVGNATSDTKWAVATAVPVGAAGTVKLSYGRNRLGSTAASDNSSALSLVYNHALSKRTVAYAGVTRVGNGDVGNVGIKGDFVPLAGQNARLLAVGLSHSF